MKQWLVILSMLLLTSCSIDPFRLQTDGAPTRAINPNHIPDIVPKIEARSTMGNPPYYTVRGQTYHTQYNAENYTEKGIASWYGTRFHGRQTSNGEIFDMFAVSAAHKTLPLPTYAQVTNLNNGKKIIVRINDRGPFHENRTIDLSYAAATKLGFVKQGTTPVALKVIMSSIPLTPSENTPSANTPSESSHTPKIYLQMAAFKNKDNAVRFKNRLSEKIQLSDVQIYKTAQHRFYKVQVGPVHSIKASQSLNEKLAQLGYKEPQLIKR